MSLTRPAFEVTVENLDNPWTSTIAAGATPDPLDGAWLADGFELQWAFEKLPLPSQLEPETAKFGILADGMANLPRFELGDRVLIDLVRPTLTDPIRYMRFGGRITDSNLVTDAVTGRVLLSLIATDPTAEIAQLDYDTPTEFPFDSSVAVESAFRSAHKARSGALVVYSTNPPQFDDLAQVVYGKDDVTAYDAISRLLAAGLNETPGEGFPIQRYATVADMIGAGWFYLYNPPTGYPLMTDYTYPWAFYLCPWNRDLTAPLPALFEYEFSATDPDQVTTDRNATDPDPDGSVILLDAEHLLNRPSWKRDRSMAPNIVSVIGHQTLDPFDDAAPVIATDSLAQERFGPIARPPILADTTEAGAAILAERYLELMPANSADAWQLRDPSIPTHLMDDATLDDYAPLFWTERAPTIETMGRLIALYDVEDDVDPSGGISFYDLAGATFSCSGGKLTITPDLVPAPGPATAGYSAGPTYDAFGASAFGNATYHDQGGSTDYLDPTLTYDRAKFTSL